MKKITYTLLLSILMFSCNFLEKIDKKIGMPRACVSIEEALKKRVFIQEYSMKDTVLIGDYKTKFVSAWLENAWTYEVDSLDQIFVCKKENYQLIIRMKDCDVPNHEYALANDHQNQLGRRGNCFHTPMENIPTDIKFLIGIVSTDRLISIKKIKEIHLVPDKHVFCK